MVQRRLMARSRHEGTGAPKWMLMLADTGPQPGVSSAPETRSHRTPLATSLRVSNALFAPLACQGAGYCRSARRSVFVPARALVRSCSGPPAGLWPTTEWPKEYGGRF